MKHKVRIALSQAQFDALVSFTYNTTYHANQHIYDIVNSGDFTKVAAAISAAVRVSIGSGKNKKFQTAPGLIKRRAEESAPFRVVKKDKATTEAIR